VERPIEKKEELLEEEDEEDMMVGVWFKGQR
jgi:hypothetical protein